MSVVACGNTRSPLEQPNPPIDVIASGLINRAHHTESLRLLLDGGHLDFGVPQVILFVCLSDVGREFLFGLANGYQRRINAKEVDRAVVVYVHLLGQFRMPEYLNG